MSLTVYFVRHVQSMGNIRRVIQGSMDEDISENGARQLENIRDRFKSISIDKVYVSQMIRARKTAVALVGGRDISTVVDERLSEINCGIWEGQAITDLIENDFENISIWKNQPHLFSVEGSEHMRDVYARAGSAVKDIIDENEQGAIAVVSHGCTIRNILCFVTGKDFSQLREVPIIRNGAVNKITFDKSYKGEVSYINDYTHIDESTLTVSMNEFIKEKDK